MTDVTIDDGDDHEADGAAGTVESSAGHDDRSTNAETEQTTIHYFE